MTVKELTKEQVEYVYEKSMVADFPRSERKPLAMIMKSIDAGTYECLGVFEGKEIIGYAFFVKKNNDYLFDYLAIMEEYRNSGVGAFFLKNIAEYYQSADSVIGEVEDYELTDNEADKELQKRRYGFYLRNGYEDTGVRTKTFGVDFIILKMHDGKEQSKEEIAKLYKSHYKAFLPRFMYWLNIKVK